MDKDKKEWIEADEKFRVTAKDLLAKHLPAARQMDAENAVRLLISYLGVNPDSPGLTETPARVVKALKEMTSGYQIDLPALFKTFDESYDEMVVTDLIPFTSLCEHHLLPFSGTACIGYLPDGKVLGLSKMPRLVDAWSRQLQLQERMTQQIASSMVSGLAPKGCGVIVRATHSCVECRGVRKSGVVVTTCALKGLFREDQRTRQEFLRLARR